MIGIDTARQKTFVGLLIGRLIGHGLDGVTALGRSPSRRSRGEPF